MGNPLLNMFYIVFLSVVYVGLYVLHIAARAWNFVTLGL